MIQNYTHYMHLYGNHGILQLACTAVCELNFSTLSMVSGAFEKKQPKSVNMEKIFEFLTVREIEEFNFI